MAAYLNTLDTEVEAFIATAIPATSGNNWLAEVAERASLGTQATLGNIPFTVRLYDGFEQADWGMQNHAYEGTIEIILVRQSPEDIPALRTDLEALRDALEAEQVTPTLSNGQILEVLAVSTSATLPWSFVMISKLLPYVTGYLAFRVVVGERP